MYIPYYITHYLIDYVDSRYTECQSNRGGEQRHQQSTQIMRVSDIRWASSIELSDGEWI